MQPDFCRSCHIMEPYYQAWHSSSHKNVPCTDCHFEPGLENTLYGKFQASSQAVKYITKTYGSKPHAEIRDVSCMRVGCHERRLLEGKVNWTVKSVTGRDVTIQFDHTPAPDRNRRGKQLRCVSCHSQIVQGEHLVVTLDTCFLCHFKGKEHGRDENGSAAARAATMRPRQQIRLSTGMFNHQEFLSRGVTCENCHADSDQGRRTRCRSRSAGTATISRRRSRSYGETASCTESHINQHKVECSSCHIQIEHDLTAGAIADLEPCDARQRQPAACATSRRTSDRRNCIEASAGAVCRTCPAPCRGLRSIASPATRRASSPMPPPPSSDRRFSPCRRVATTATATSTKVFWTSGNRRSRISSTKPRRPTPWPGAGGCGEAFRYRSARRPPDAGRCRAEHPPGEARSRRAQRELFYGAAECRAGAMQISHRADQFATIHSGGGAK